VSPRNWQLRVEDILQAIAAIRAYTHGMAQETFADDQRTIDAVMHNITIIGEAAGHIPDEIAGRYPELPWDKMRAIRNVIVHMYFGIRREILWQTIQDDLSPLVPHLKKMLADAP
jgi:uncharacterized protein with HEPN domain